MPLKNLQGKTQAVPVRDLTLEDFGGGLDLSGRIARISDRHLLQAKNVDLRAGRARSRHGYLAVTTTLPTATFEFGYYSATFDSIFLFSTFSDIVYKVNDLSTTGTFVNISSGFPSPGTHPQLCDAVDFNGVLVVAHPQGIYTYDGSTWTLQTSAVKGTMIAAWQNKLWVVDGLRVWFSNAGSYSTWDSVNDWVDFRDGVDAGAPITAIHATQEMDSIGRSSLLVCKKYSVHRVNSPTTGAYSTLSSGVGVEAHRAIASGDGKTLFVSESGIYLTNGQSVPQKISGAIDPLFEFDAHNVSTSVKSRAVWFNGGFKFSMPGYDPVTAQQQTFKAVVHVDWDPDSGAWSSNVLAGHTLGVGAYIAVPSGALIAGSSFNRPRLFSLDSSGPPQKMFMHDTVTSSTTDGGTANTAVIQTPYFSPAGGTRVRLHRLRVEFFNAKASGTFTLRVRKDGSSTDSAVYTRTGLTQSTLTPLDFNRLGNCHSVSFVFEFPVGIESNIGNFSSTRPDAHIRELNELVAATLEFTPTGRN